MDAWSGNRENRRGENAVNVMFKAGSLFALGVTIMTLLAGAWNEAPGVFKFVSDNRAFFYGLSIGITAAGLTKKIVLVLIIIAVVFVFLKWAGW